MSRRHILILILILILAGFLRFYQLTSTPPGLYPDEAMNGNNALEALHTGNFKIYYPENNGREGLFIDIQAAFLKYFGVNEAWALRLPSAIFGTLTVLGMYFLAAELFSSPIGLLSAFFLATNFWHINFSRIGFRAIMAPLLLVWALYLLIRALRKVKTTSYSLLAICAGILYGLGFYTYIAYRVTPVLMGIIILWHWYANKEPARRRIILFSTFYFLFSAFLVALPIGLYYLGHPADFFGRTSEISIFSSPAPLHDLGVNILKTAGMFNFEGDGNWRHNYAGRPELFLPVGVLFLIGLTLAIKNIIQNLKIKYQNYSLKIESYPAPQGSKILHFDFSFLILMLWFLLAALPVVISNEGLPHALRAILMLPPVIILAAVGGVALYNVFTKYAPRNFLRGAAVIVIVIVTAEAYQTYFLRWASNPNVHGAFAADYVAIGREMNRLPQGTPKYVVVEAGGVNIRGVPMPAQTVMFITNSFLPEMQAQKNIHYILPTDSHNIRENAGIFYIR